jgi:3-oxoacyl-[acyl-carrier-protein] synthase II
MGVVSPLGTGTEAAWARLIAGESGLRRLPAELAPDVPAQVAGTVQSKVEDAEAGFDLDAAVPGKDQKKMDRFIQFALAAADEAIGQAGWAPETEAQKDRTATIIATGIGGFPAIAEAVRITDDRGVRRLSPFTVPSFLANLAAGWVSIRHGFKGPLGAPVTACAAGVQAIGDAARDGFVMGEGAGILVIEALDHALARGAKPIAELVGYGTSADAFHLTAGPEDGEGAARAMRIALAQASVEPAAVGHLNAHATSTPVGDKGELAAIKAVFGEGEGPAISSTKSATGHLLGAAGGLEAVFTVLALRDGVIPPTLNLENPDEAAAGLDLVALTARKADLDYALSNGFGFGGVNASVLFKKWAE